MSRSLSTLHTVNKSPFSSEALASCLRVVRPGDAILLMEDGVYCAVDASASAEASLARDAEGSRLSRARPAPTGVEITGVRITGVQITEVRIYALREDLQARGIDAATLPSDIEPVSYTDFVRLVCEHGRSVSWL
jgi:tRNA 2-thiouridine synthesizing protein B